MVSPILYGRFGNQLWQIIHCMAYAKKHNLAYHIPTHTANDAVWKPMFDYMENPKFDTSLPAVRIEEKQHGYHEVEFKEEWRDKNIFLSGYFQSYKYFDWCIDEIRRYFLVDTLQIKHKTTSAHLRRGDYLLYPTKHPVCTISYYQQAIIYLNSDGRNNKDFMLVSDDVPYFREMFQKELFHCELSKMGGYYSFSASEDTTEFKDFNLMMQCENNICANSSFSVLAAILNPNPNKIVICPHVDNYFGIDNKHLSVQDLYPSEFVQIKY